MRGASASLTPVVLELGGKDPLVVCEDADLNTLVSVCVCGLGECCCGNRQCELTTPKPNLDTQVPVAMRAIYQSCGQNCIAPERFYVYDSVYDEFAERVSERVRSTTQPRTHKQTLNCFPLLPGDKSCQEAAPRPTFRQTGV